MFTSQPFTENKAVINVKTVQIPHSIFQPKSDISINPSVNEMQHLMQMTNFPLKIVTVSLKNGF